MLCRELGYTLNDLLNSLGDGELDLWYEFHKRQPLSNPWYQTGVICNTFARYNGWHDHRTKPEEFMPVYRPPVTSEQLYNQMLWGLVGAGCRLVDTDGKPVDMGQCLTSSARSTPTTKKP